MLIFGATANCIPWVYVPDILPLHVRAKGTTVGISSNWIWNLFVVMITPNLINNLAEKGYLISMCLDLAFVPLVYFCYAETSHLTLEEIDWLFYEGNVVRRSRRVAKHGWEAEEDKDRQCRGLEHEGDGSKGKEDAVEHRETASRSAVSSQDVPTVTQDHASLSRSTAAHRAAFPVSHVKPCDLGPIQIMYALTPPQPQEMRRTVKNWHSLYDAVDLAGGYCNTNTQN
ncbi:hypothetical protein P154DRAFT_577136 [Amniculicola lignicola CBS 123094]|uniref:Major facilitator superfamily (MFS) profile domain-containing protein n=1 Tax=Amniculicola lignicola CBS 123094 TaxID=1392246 RepID=A0A6A5WCN2_9PLEO|nr:hypothetical protein P154DRAFT_577136 [Amniculicola lignicola CBS 123094]